MGDKNTDKTNAVKHPMYFSLIFIYPLYQPNHLPKAMDTLLKLLAYIRVVPGLRFPRYNNDLDRDNPPIDLVVDTAEQETLMSAQDHSLRPGLVTGPLCSGLGRFLGLTPPTACPGRP